MASSPPTTEIGRVTDRQMPGIPAWTQFVDVTEYVPELVWPQSIQVYVRMMATSQIGGLLKSVQLPLQRMRWYLDPLQAQMSKVQKLSADLGLPILGREDAGYLKSRRTKGRFNFSHHLKDALRALGYGHYFFEQVGEVEDDELWHLRKLAPRPPRSILEINVAEDGGLIDIKQNFGPTAPSIPVERLVAYVWDMEAGQWVGRPMIRECYQSWLIKDRLMRVDAINHETAGKGTGLLEAPPGASREEIEALGELARRAKVVEGGGGAVPAGTNFLSTNAKAPNTVESMRYHDEQMAGDFLAMFKQLGTTQTGSRALGESFLDFFDLGLQAVAEWVCEVFTPHVIEDYWDWNYGEDDPAPKLCFHQGDEQVGWTDFAALVNAGVIKVDPTLEEEIRDRLKLPEIDEEYRAQLPQPPAPGSPTDQPAEQPPSSEPAPSGDSEQSGASDVRAAEALAPSLPLPDRPLRRQLYQHEIVASVDFAQMEAQVGGAVDQTANEVRVLQRSQIDQLHDLIIEANGSLKKLATIEADPIHGDTLLAAMHRMAQVGMDSATGEAKRQGVENARQATLDDVRTLLANRAQATDSMLAKRLSEAAQRQAVRRTAKSVPPSEVAAKVKGYLQGLKGTYLRDQVNGALMGAMNTGRKAIMNRNAPRAVYASELMDDATCEFCADVDGTEYLSMQDAEGDYPTGGYSDCAGIDRCRGTLVAVYPEAGVD